ncbi:MAG: hypothetical protein EHM56_01015 [Chloroflexi bacterium]|nr:MAG: hypothetical protein EHM56_01015 [Chloroflexota bacterium]
MDELINMVASKAGISQEQAQKAVTVVVGFLKDKLPAPIAGQIDSVLKGGKGGLGDVAGGLGGMLGKK